MIAPAAMPTHQHNTKMVASVHDAWNQVSLFLSFIIFSYLLTCVALAVSEFPSFLFGNETLPVGNQ